MIRTYTKIESDNRREYGYGLYVNAYVVDCSPPGIEQEMGLWASECVPRNASDSRIARARRRVRQNARNRYQRWLDKI